MSEETKQIMDFLTSFRDEFVDFKDEMTGFKEQSLSFQQEMSSFKEQSLGFQGEMLTFRDEVRQAFTEVNTRLDRHDELLIQLTDSVAIIDLDVKELKINQLKTDEKVTNLIGTVSVLQTDMDLAYSKILFNERKLANLEKQIQA